MNFNDICRAAASGYTRGGQVPGSRGPAHGRVICDLCHEAATWKVYAAYPYANAVHPQVAHYPRPMIRACDEHLAAIIARDQTIAGATAFYLVEPCT